MIYVFSVKFGYQFNFNHFCIPGIVLFFFKFLKLFGLGKK